MRQLLLVGLLTLPLACGGSSKSGGGAGLGDAGGIGSDGGATSIAEAGGADGGGASDGGGFAVDAVVPLDAPSAETIKVYAHSDSTLYQLDPKTLAISSIGPFTAAGGFTDQMTDIALDKDGQMFGVSFTTLYRIDYKSVAGEARVAKMADLPSGLDFNGLTMVPAGMLDPSVEVLVGITRGGDSYRIDVGASATTATASKLGSYGGNWGNSGDAVGIIGDAVYAAMFGQLSGNVDIGVIAPKTGAVTKDLGPTGLMDDGSSTGLWGVGYWGGTMYAFSADGKVYSIDLSTGVAKNIPVSGGPSSWWGAGVSTSAPRTVPS
jgi:hypothetical protein